MGLAALATLPAYDATFGLMEWLMKGLSRNRGGLSVLQSVRPGRRGVRHAAATFCAGMTLP
jgi:hypothetical protein